MIRKVTIAVIIVGFLAMTSNAQLSWDKRKTGEPVPNPTSVQGAHDEIVKQVKMLIKRNSIALASESHDEERGGDVYVTEPVVFARGIVARTQLGHFAEVDYRLAPNVIQGRVTIRIEVTPASPTLSLVGVSTKFEGLVQSAGQSWTAFPSRGLLEDRVLKHLLTGFSGQSFDDVKPDDMILDPKADASPTE